MVQVSRAFKDYIYRPERTTKAKVSFEIIDVETYTDATVAVSSEAILSRKDQVINKQREMTHKYATFERDYFSLDGSSFIPPKATEGESELGWWSDEISGENGIFLTAPVLTCSFSVPHNSIGLTITFDSQANEYASDFEIKVFGPNDTLITTENITNNSSPLYTFQQNLDNYQKVQITIKKWATPLRRARIVEVDFGIIQEYTGDKLISLDVIEEMDLLGNTVPSNEISFTLDNSDNAFNILNPNGIYRFLKPNQEIKAQIGLKISDDSELYEYINMGAFYLHEWTVDEGAMTSTFVGRDVFTRLEETEYTNSLTNTNLYDLAEDVLVQANVERYNIDVKLKEITTNGFIEPLNAREALQHISMAGRSAIKQNRNGSVEFVQLDALTVETGYVTFTGPDMFTGMTTPEIYIDYTFQVIDFESTYQIPKVSLSNAVRSLVFKIHDGVSDEPYPVEFINPDKAAGDKFEINNPLINSEQQASIVAEWMFREYNLLAEYQANWRQNPALECADVLLIEDSFGGMKKSRITKQEFNFAGYLDGNTETKGGI
jgi:hypothetical protein